MVLTHHSGMTAFGHHFFTSGQALSASGRKAWSAGVVPTSL
jgi:hypothetical protein